MSKSGGGKEGFQGDRLWGLGVGGGMLQTLGLLLPLVAKKYHDMKC